MNYLLDTHVFLWMLVEPRKLKAKARDAIVDPGHEVFVSAVTSVEIAIKRNLGKLDAPDDLGQEIERRGLIHLPLHYRHGERLAQLPQHHQNPLDRMLIAQALEDHLTLITHDRKFEPYAAKILWT